MRLYQVAFGILFLSSPAMAWSHDPTLPDPRTITNTLNDKSLANAKGGAGGTGIAGGSFGGSASAPTSVNNNTTLNQRGGWAAPSIAFGEGSGGGADCPTSGWSILGLGAG